MKARLCPVCGAYSDDNVWHCLCCQETLSVDTLVEVDPTIQFGLPSRKIEKSGESLQPTSKNFQDRFFCPNCGVGLVSRYNFCPTCGFNLTNVTINIINNWEDSQHQEEDKDLNASQSFPSKQLLPDEKNTSASPNADLPLWVTGLPLTTKAQEVPPSPKQQQFTAPSQVTVSPGVGCAFPGCQNPVIGQCFGYDKSCGHYYCRDHSTGIMCWDCAQRKFNAEELQKQNTLFLKEAEQIRKARTPFEISFLIITLIAIVWFFYNKNNINLGNIVNRLDLAGLVIGTVCFNCILIILIVISYEYRMSKARALDDTMPGFYEFYKEWRKAKTREEIGKSVAIIGTVTLAAIAGAVDSAARESEENRRKEKIDTAVRDELDRRGY